MDQQSRVAGSVGRRGLPERPRRHGIRAPGVRTVAPRRAVERAWDPSRCARGGPRRRRLARRPLPRDAVLRLIGGESHRFYVEVDGDESELDGENFAAGASARPWFDQGRWRIEIQPPAERARDRFLVLLSPSRGAPRPGHAQPLSDVAGTARGVLGETGRPYSWTRAVRAGSSWTLAPGRGASTWWGCPRMPTPAPTSGHRSWRSGTRGVTCAR